MSVVFQSSSFLHLAVSLMSFSLLRYFSYFLSYSVFLLEQCHCLFSFPQTITPDPVIQAAVASSVYISVGFSVVDFINFLARIAKCILLSQSLN
jgi:hypothetical protein